MQCRTENTRALLKIFANQIIMYILHKDCTPAYSIHETRPVTHTLYHTIHYTNLKNNNINLNLYKVKLEWQISINMSGIYCYGCKRQFGNERSLSHHFQHNQTCKSIHYNLNLQSTSNTLYQIQTRNKTKELNGLIEKRMSFFDIC